MVAISSGMGVCSPRDRVVFAETDSLPFYQTAAILECAVIVIPAKAGIQRTFLLSLTFWIPAFAGMMQENYVSRVGCGLSLKCRKSLGTMELPCCDYLRVDLTKKPCQSIN